MTSQIAYLNMTHFGLKIRHNIPPRSSQDAHMTPQDGSKRFKTSPRRLQDASKTTPRRLQDGSRYSQEAPKTALNFPRHPKMLPRRPKTLQDTSQTPPRRLQTSMLAPPSLIFWRFFQVILLIFRCFEDHFLDDSYSLGAVAGTQLCCALDI